MIINMIKMVREWLKLAFLERLNRRYRPKEK
jgi:hypothetical protein